MPRITIDKLFPIKEGNYILIDQTNSLIRDKRTVPLWHRLSPVAMLLYQPPEINHVFKGLNVGGYRRDQIICFAANTSHGSMLTKQFQGEQNAKP